MNVVDARFVKAAHAPEEFLRDGRPEVAIVGRSNVGKSSLINKLLGRRGLARTSTTPGRTRAVNYFLVNDRFYLVDLPGYGYARAGRRERQKWGQVVDAYLGHAAPALRTILLIDAKIPGSPLDRQAAQYLLGLGARLTVAVTKIDRVPRNKRRQRLHRVRELLELSDDSPIIPVSARTGEGIADLWKELPTA